MATTPPSTDPTPINKQQQEERRRRFRDRRGGGGEGDYSSFFLRYFLLLACYCTLSGWILLVLLLYLNYLIIHFLLEAL